MNTGEFLTIQPSQYLKNGFFDENGEIFDGLNGYYSLAMAYRLTLEKADIDQLRNIVSRLMEIASKHDNVLKENPHLPLDDANAAAYVTVRTKTNSPTVAAIFDAADRWVTDWKGFASLTLHLKRILGQATMLRNLSGV
jgi:hypothetical protein